MADQLSKMAATIIGSNMSPYPRHPGLLVTINHTLFMMFALKRIHPPSVNATFLKTGLHIATERI